MISDKQKAEFVWGFLTAALWSSSYTCEDETVIESLICEDWAPGEDDRLAQECHDFMLEHCELLESYVALRTYSGEYTAWEAAGHDFWLARCGHGTGFWDRGCGEAGDLLTALVGYSTEYPPLDLYLNEDDGYVYWSEPSKVYAVQYRLMHNAHHYLSLFESLEGARQVAAWMADENRQGDCPATCISMLEIDYRNPPHYWSKPGEGTNFKIRIVNKTDVPDVY